MTCLTGGHPQRILRLDPLCPPSYRSSLRCSTFLVLARIYGKAGDRRRGSQPLAKTGASPRQVYDTLCAVSKYSSGHCCKSSSLERAPSEFVPEVFFYYPCPSSHLSGPPETSARGSVLACPYDKVLLFLRAGGRCPGLIDGLSMSGTLTAPKHSPRPCQGEPVSQALRERPPPTEVASIPLQAVFARLVIRPLVPATRQRAQLEQPAESQTF